MSRVWLWILFTNSCNQGFIPVRGYCSCVIGMSEYRTKPRCNRWGLLRSLRTRTRISSGPQAKVKVKCTGYCHIAEGGYQCPLIYKIWHKTKLLGDLLKACLDNIVQVITARFFNNRWNEVPLFLKRHNGLDSGSGEVSYANDLSFSFDVWFQGLPKGACISWKNIFEECN